MIKKVHLSQLNDEQLQIKPASLLAAEAELTVAEIKRSMKCGAVWLSRQGQHRRLRRADTKLKKGDELALYYNAKVLAETVDDCQLLLDETEFSLWYKPSGVMSQGSLWGDHTTINRFVEAYFEPARPAFIVSRLDKSASGLMIIAHGKKAAAKVSALFETRNIKKQYQAIVLGDASYLKRPRWVEVEVGGKAARSCVQCEGVSNEYNGAIYSLVNVAIETGRKHQIRQHLASLGLPIWGDRLYGEAELDAPDLQLRCAHLAFNSPFTGEDCSFYLPPALQLSSNSPLNFLMCNEPV